MKHFSIFFLAVCLLSACQTTTQLNTSGKRQFLYQKDNDYSRIDLEIDTNNDVTAEIYSHPDQTDYDIYFIGIKKGNEIEGLEHQSAGDRVYKQQNVWLLQPHALVRNGLTHQEISTH
ncbi:MAG: hypothetical protein K1X66_02745 [Verrucomicrobiae bacterium]|nr:hypothetical protein [Verrucomicrobiae bacterium]